MNRFPSRTVMLSLAALIPLLLGALLTLGRQRPSHQRPWRVEHSVLPDVAFQGSLVHIDGVRNNQYRTAEQFTPRWERRTYDLDRVESVWLVLSPFQESWRGPAHVFLSFGFSDGRYLSVSVEARREEGEEYSIWKGLLRKFELMYVIGDERDLIGLRAVLWNDPTYLYPIQATPEQARETLVRMLRRAAAVHQRPEFYNTLWNNCTTNIVDQVNQFATRRIRWGWQILLPGYSDDLAYGMGLIDNALPLDAARDRYRINQRAQAAWDETDFSRRIRS